jgi:hypothetical protein
VPLDTPEDQDDGDPHVLLRCFGKSTGGPPLQEVRVGWLVYPIGSEPTPKPPATTGADPSVGEWGHRPPLKFLNFYSICTYLKEISVDFAKLYTKCPRSVDLPPLLYFSGSSTGLQHTHEVGANHLWILVT